VGGRLRRKQRAGCSASANYTSL
jgi:hypothetical protein